MTNLKHIQAVYFVGIGGIGMSALARYFNFHKKMVAGYDLTSTELTQTLEGEEIDIHYEDDVNLIPKEILDLPKDQVLVVYTPAISFQNSELTLFLDEGYDIMKRSQVLGLITKENKTIGVAGTHGKTTTSSIVAHLLKHSGVAITAFLGGITQNYGTNLLLAKKSEYIVVEADEFDRSFLTLTPEMTIITSVDADHLDIYGEEKYLQESFSMYAKQVVSGGTIISKNGIAEKLDLDAVTENNTVKNNYKYSLTERADFYTENLRPENGKYHFDVVTPTDKIMDCKFGFPGLHNVENAVSAIAIAQEVGISNEKIKAALETFKGVKRRFEYHVNNHKHIYIDDYAHHPEELKACIASLRDLFPGKKITGVFQPHLYSRTRDFMDDFATSLNELDELLLLDIYPAREEPIEGITSSALLEKITLKNKKLTTKQNLVKDIHNTFTEVLVTMGAGDISNMVQPIKESLEV
jgi:UDP-N-acetylmuramate--alanine ligase